MSKENVINEFRNEFLKIRKEKLEKYQTVINLKNEMFENAGYINTLIINFENVHKHIDEPAKECIEWLQLMNIKYKVTNSAYVILSI